MSNNRITTTGDRRVTTTADVRVVTVTVEAVGLAAGFGRVDSPALYIESDDANRADTVDLGTSWNDGYTGNNNLQIVNGRYRCTVIGTASMESFVGAIDNDQWARIRIPTLSPTTGSTLLIARVQLRMASTPTYTCYEFAACVNDTGNARTSSIARRAAGTETIIVKENVTTWLAGDELLATVRYDTLRLYRISGGVYTLLLTTTDTNVATGTPGQRLFVDATGTVADLETDNFVAGNFDVLATTIVNESFTHADDPDIGANFTVPAGTVAFPNARLDLVSNAVRASAVSTGCAEYNTDVFGDDIWAQVDLKTFTGANLSSMILFLRFVDIDNFYYVQAINDGTGTHTRIGKRVKGVTTTNLATSTVAWSSGQQLYGSARGNEIAIYQNGLFLLRAVDSDIRYGYTGMRAYTDSAVSTCEFDNFLAGKWDTSALGNSIFSAVGSSSGVGAATGDGVTISTEKVPYQPQYAMAPVLAQ